MRALVIALVLVAACSGNNNNIVLLDASPGPPDQRVCGVVSSCSVLTQTGCNTGEKCSWLHANDVVGTEPVVGGIACAPAGAVPLGGACRYGPVDPTNVDPCFPANAYDNCVGGTVCYAGICEQICDDQGGSPACPAAQACTSHDGLFANTGATTHPAGVCEATCNPLDDNDFDGSGTKFTRTGTTCGSSATTGCYGIPSYTHTSYFTCAQPASGTGLLTHRSVLPPGSQYLNSCMSGYTIGELYSDDSGSMEVVCLAFCKPGEAYAGNPGTQQPNGAAPHRCNTTDALGAFGATPDGTAASNGEHCMYSWLFEVDTGGTLHPSPTSDTVGICVDHTKYHYDSNGDGTLDTLYPPCASLPLTATATTLGAGDLGCVKSTTAGVAFDGKKRLRLGIQLPELHLHR